MYPNFQVDIYPNANKALINSTKKLHLISKRIRHYSTQNTVEFSHQIEYCLNTLDQLSYKLKASIKTRSLVSNIRNSQYIKLALQQLISLCSILEMKNSPFKSNFKQLKDELYLLNTIQKKWFLINCNKN